MEIASHHQRHRAAQWRVSSKSEDARLVADCPSRRALTVRSNYQWSDPYATDRRLARPQASFSVKSRLRGDSQALVDLRSFVISQLWKKFFRHGYRRNQFPPQLGSRPRSRSAFSISSLLFITRALLVFRGFRLLIHDVCPLNQATRDALADRSAFLIRFANFVSRDRATVVTAGLLNCPKREEG
jgi:hypothetical protein